MKDVRVVVCYDGDEKVIFAGRTKNAAMADARLFIKHCVDFQSEYNLLPEWALLKHYTIKPKENTNV